MYKKVELNDDGFVGMEREVAQVWKDKDIIKKNFARNEGKRYFTFYDGPPTANGMPHAGHILTRVMKDIIPRYKVMQGYRVIRKAGWDTHGLPVELEIEKKLGISGKEQIEEYGVEKGEAEKLIGNFLQVIIDASDYLFSKNHADPYTFLGFACAYLRHYYTLETITSALNIYVSDKEKSLNIKEYAISKGYTIEPIKFRKSRAEYEFDKENNKIYQGIASIKFCNSIIADELYSLRNNKYNSFIELIADIKSKTSVNTRQLEILTGLNFFSEFGKNKYLLNVINIYNKFSSCKQINKSKLESLGISEFIAKKYSEKETPSLFKGIDNIGLITELCKNLENKEMGIIEMVKFEKEHLEMVVYTNKQVGNDYYIIVDYKTYKDTTKPYFTARKIKTGEEVHSRIKQSKIFKENPFGLYSVLKIKEFMPEFKKKFTDGKWGVTDETEDVLTEYEVIKS